jgi:hypothetical protein
MAARQRERRSAALNIAGTLIAAGNFFGSCELLAPGLDFAARFTPR